MSEEQAITDAFEDYEEVESESTDDGQIVEDEIVEDKQQEDEPQYSALELEAREDGHTTKDEWTAAGKDPERWKSAHEFVEYGKIKGALDKSKADQDKLRDDYDKRFENLNKLHKAETDAKIKELKADQRRAVEEADTDAYDEAQNKIEELKEEPAEEEAKPSTSKNSDIAEWEAKNSWINDPADPKAQAAQGLFNGYTQANPNATAKQSLEYVDSQLKSMGLVKAPANPRRDAPGETTRAPSAPRQTGKISMSDLTQEERQLWANAGSDLWGGNQKDFLQSVKDSRR